MARVMGQGVNKMKVVTLDEKDLAYKTARTCHGYVQLSRLTERDIDTLQKWNKNRKFAFKPKFCTECSSPISKSQPEETTLCQLCTMEINRNKYLKRKSAT